MTITLEQFLEEKGCSGKELLSHPETAHTQTAAEWAAEFLSNNPNNDKESSWLWADFDGLVDVTAEVQSGEIYLKNGIAIYTR